MKYEANPVKVDAHIIVSVSPILGDGSMVCDLQNGTSAVASRVMIARFIPQAGDYWVVQEDDYVYVNPKDVFERKYKPIREDQATTGRVGSVAQALGGFQSLKELRFVYVRALVKGDPAEHSNYYDGEYIVMSVGAAKKSFTGCKMATGYEFQANVRAFDEQIYEIVDSYDDDAAIERCIGDNSEWLAGPRDKWVEHVYSRVEDNLRRLKRLMEMKTGKKPEATPTTTKSLVCHSCSENLKATKDLTAATSKLLYHLGIR